MIRWKMWLIGEEGKDYKYHFIRIVYLNQDLDHEVVVRSAEAI